MIRSFSDKDAEGLFRGRFSRRLPHDIQRIAQRRLLQINAVNALADLRVPPVHPGEQLREEFMVQALVAERRSVTGDTALRLARYFGTSPEFWLNLQRDYDLDLAKLQAGATIEATVHPRAA